MIYVGIDIAKRTHYASVMNSDGEILAEPFPFTNDHAGFQKLLSCIGSFPKEQLLIGMESTAHYAENLTCFLFSSDFQVCIINPIQTASLRTASSILSKPHLYVSLTFVKRKQTLLIRFSSLKHCLYMITAVFQSVIMILCN